MFSADPDALIAFARLHGLRRRHVRPYLHYDVTEAELEPLLAAGVVMLDRRAALAVLNQQARKGERHALGPTMELTNGKLPPPALGDELEPRPPQDEMGAL